MIRAAAPACDLVCARAYEYSATNPLPGPLPGAPPFGLVTLSHNHVWIDQQ